MSFQSTRPRRYAESLPHLPNRSLEPAGCSLRACSLSSPPRYAAHAPTRDGPDAARARRRPFVSAGTGFSTGGRAEETRARAELTPKVDGRKSSNCRRKVSSKVPQTRGIGCDHMSSSIAAVAVTVPPTGYRGARGYLQMKLRLTSDETDHELKTLLVSAPLRPWVSQKVSPAARSRCDPTRYMARASRP